MVGVGIVIGSRFFGVVWTTYFRGEKVCPCADYAMASIGGLWKLRCVAVPSGSLVVNFFREAHGS